MGSFMGGKCCGIRNVCQPGRLPDNWIAVLRDVQVKWATPVLLLRP